MFLPKSVRWAALAWGLVVFMPVGLNYLAGFLLMLCLLLAGGWRERAARLRRHALWWPAVAYLGVTLVALVALPHYPETPSNLVHGLRIVLTLALALCLTRDEAAWALSGFVVSAVYALAVVLIHHSVGLPRFELWQNLVLHLGNKSIANAILFALIASSALVLALDRGGWLRIVAIGLAVVLIAVDIWLLPSRTSVLGVLLTLVGACIHLWRRHARALVAGLLACALLAAVTVSTVPYLRARFDLGLDEVQRASAGSVAHESWSVRYHMYRLTLDMIGERPWTGWGVGSWNTEWRARAPELLRDYNMPHNDYLWMGAQAGLAGAIALLALTLALLVPGWRRQDLGGRLALAAGLTLIQAACWNSAMRDAAIGLSVLWVVGLYVRLADGPDDSPPVGAGLSGGEPPLPRP